MPRLDTWGRFPEALQQHLLGRLKDRAFSVQDLDHLRQWVQSAPTVPSGPWFKDFGSFKLCGEGPLPKIFLRPGQAARGRRLAPCRGTRRRRSLLPTARAGVPRPRGAAAGWRSGG